MQRICHELRKISVVPIGRRTKINHAYCIAQRNKLVNRRNKMFTNIRSTKNVKTHA